MDDDATATDDAAAPDEIPAAEGGRFGFKLFDQARKAKEQAQAKAADLASKAGELREHAHVKAGELKDQATTRAGEFKDQATAKAEEVKDQVAAKAGEIRDAGQAKIAEMIDDFNAALPVVREAGYMLAGVEIGIGLSPKIVAGFSAFEEVSEEKVEQLLAEHAEKKFTVMLVKSIYQAWKLQTKIKIAGMKPTGISVEIALVPLVSIKFA